MSDSSGDEGPRPPGRRNTPSCQVKGCTNTFPVGVSYHRRYRVCLHHASLPQLILNSQVVRWCQQCGKFHDIAEFDGARKTCRIKLAIHNAQRKAARERRRRGISPGGRGASTERSSGSRGTQSHLNEEGGPSGSQPPRFVAAPPHRVAPLGLPVPPGHQGIPFDGLDIEALLNSVMAEQGAAEPPAEPPARCDNSAASLMAMAAGLKRAAWDVMQHQNSQQPPPGDLGIAFPAAYAPAAPGTAWLPPAQLGDWPAHAPPPPRPPLPQFPSISLTSTQTLVPQAPAASASAPTANDIYDASMRLFGVPPSALPPQIIESLTAVLVANEGSQK